MKRGFCVKQGIIFDKNKKVLPLITAIIGVILGIALLALRLNIVAVVKCFLTDGFYAVFNGNGGDVLVLIESIVGNCNNLCRF